MMTLVNYETGLENLLYANMTKPVAKQLQAYTGTNMILLLKGQWSSKDKLGRSSDPDALYQLSAQSCLGSEDFYNFYHIWAHVSQQTVTTYTNFPSPYNRHLHMVWWRSVQQFQRKMFIGVDEQWMDSDHNSSSRVTGSNELKN